jgi:hypothetical protein
MMEKIILKDGVPIVVVFLSTSKKVHEALTEYGPRDYWNYTVNLQKVGDQEVNEKLILQASGVLEREFASRNVEPGHRVQITMNKLPKTTSYKVLIDKDMVPVEVEEPGEVDKLTGEVLCTLMKAIHADLFEYFLADSEAKGYDINLAWASINTVFMTATKANVIKY